MKEAVKKKKKKKKKNEKKKKATNNSNDSIQRNVIKFHSHKNFVFFFSF